jgi:hypothetical protein
MFKNWIDPYDPYDVLYETNTRIRIRERRKKRMGHRNDPTRGPKNPRKRRVRWYKERFSWNDDDEDIMMDYEPTQPTSTATATASVTTNDPETTGYIPSFDEYIAQHTSTANSGVPSVSASASATPAQHQLYTFSDSGYVLLPFPHLFHQTNTILSYSFTVETVFKSDYDDMINRMQGPPVDSFFMFDYYDMVNRMQGATDGPSFVFYLPVPPNASSETPAPIASSFFENLQAIIHSNQPSQDAQFE